MNNFLNHVPGFRSNTKWKRIVAVIYYLFALTAMFDSFWTFIAAIVFPFIIFGFIDLIKGIRSVKSNPKLIALFVVPLLFFLFAGNMMPAESEENEKQLAIEQQEKEKKEEEAKLEKEKEEQQQKEKEEKEKKETEEKAKLEEEKKKEEEAKAKEEAEQKEKEEVAGVKTDSSSSNTSNNSSTSLPANFTKATVVKHVDGDTVHVKDANGNVFKIRMIGVDTPETVHPSKPVEFYGKEASNYTKSKLLGKEIYLQKDVSDTDRYGRALRYIWLSPPSDPNNESEIKSKMFNALLVINGYANSSSYPPDVKYQDYFRKYEASARNSNKGLWAGGTVEQPKQESKPAPKPQPKPQPKPEPTPEVKPQPAEPNVQTVLVTPTGSKYHREACGRGNYSEASLESAKARGLTPCKKCY